MAEQRRSQAPLFNLEHLLSCPEVINSLYASMYRSFYMTNSAIEKN